MASARRLYASPVPKLDKATIENLAQVFRQDRFIEALKYPRDTSRAQENASLDAVQKIFLRGEAVTADQAVRVLHAHDLDTLIRSGLVLEDQGWVQSPFKVQTYRGLIFLSDFFYNKHAPDFVLQVGPAGHYLANLTIRRQVNSALDLGCGCGVQSLLAAQHSTRVTATDVNLRALALTRLNAELNGLTNIETLHGSYLEPVEGRRFDLVVANLPYVIAPERQFIYRNTDQPGDSRLRRFIAEIPAYLTEGGFAHVLANWIHAAGETWWQALAGAVSGNGADAWLVYNGSKDVQAYGGMWIDHETKEDARAFARTKKSWAKWYRRQGIEQIALGAICLRRRTARSNWFCTAPVDSTLATPAGEQMERLFAAQDALSTLTRPEDLFTRALVRCQIEMAAEPGGQWVGVRLSSGLRLQTEVHAFSAKVLEHLDGGISLQAALDQAAREHGNPPVGARALALEDIRRLVELGMVLPG